MDEETKGTSADYVTQYLSGVLEGRMGVEEIRDGESPEPRGAGHLALSFWADAPWRLEPHEDDYVVKKRRVSGFFCTDLDLYLRERKINTLLLVGGPTHVSIRYTAVDAYSLRYSVFVLKDCTDSSTKEFFESALEDMFFTTRITSINYFRKFRANLLHSMQ